MEPQTQQPGTEPPIQQPETPTEAPMSILEHAATYGPNAEPDDTDSDTEAERQHHSAEQRRERQTGQFKPGRVRHRAASQQAGPDDIAAISEFTRRIKTAEERDGADIKPNAGESPRVFEMRRRAELADRRSAAESELARLRSTHASPAQIAKAEDRVDTTRAAAQAEPAKPQTGATFSKPEPKEDDPVFGGDFMKYLEAKQDYRVAKGIWEWQQEQARQATQAERDSQAQAAQRSFGERIETAKTKYPDFDAVLAQPVPWLNPQGLPHPKGVAIDYFVREHTNGPDLLYHLQTHPSERDALARMELVEQLPTLTLLLQRFASDPQQTSSQAGTTGSAAGRQPQVVLPPKPPNPVRTEAHRASASPPTDGSLSVMGHAKAFRRS